jgi:hypothetical protein
MTTSQLIDALVAHYGSTQAVNAACAAVWQDGSGNRTMLKVDALWELKKRIDNQKGQK